MFATVAIHSPRNSRVTAGTENATGGGGGGGVTGAVGASPVAHAPNSAAARTAVNTREVAMILCMA
jgi:hypothetical protein